MYKIILTSALLFSYIVINADPKQVECKTDYANPLWEVNSLSAHERVRQIENRLQKIGDVLRESFDKEDPDAETIRFHIEQIRHALYGFHATYGFRLP